MKKIIPVFFFIAVIIAVIFLVPEDTIQNIRGMVAINTESVSNKPFSTNKDSIKGSVLRKKYEIEDFNEYTDTEIKKALQLQQGLYYKDIVMEDEKVLYGVLFLALVNKDDFVLLPKNSDSLQKISQYVQMDHPEVFWVSGYDIKEYEISGYEKFTIFSWKKTLDNQTIESRQAKIEAVTDRFCATINPTDSDYEKVKKVFEYIIETTDYYQGVEDQNICSVFLEKKSVCLGYTKAVQYLLNKLGIESTVIRGETDNNQSHAWNLVKMDGDFYYMDATWGDSSYVSQTGFNQSLIPINYYYMGLTTEELKKDHRISDLISVPSCTNIEDSYYVKEGTYISSEITKEELHQMIENQLVKTNYVFLKAKDSMIYNAVKKILIEEQYIFEIVNNDEIMFMEDENKLIMNIIVS